MKIRHALAVKEPAKTVALNRNASVAVNVRMKVVARSNKHPGSIRGILFCNLTHSYIKPRQNYCKTSDYRVHSSQSMHFLEAMLITERWPSGLRRTLGKRVGREPSQVRILSSPP